MARIWRYLLRYFYNRDMNLRASLIGLSNIDRANRKADVIVNSNLLQRFRDDTNDISFKIENVQKIDGGVSIFARAWKGNKRIGFGSDGTVEIERFRIFNPPILVDDPNGDIEISETHPRTGKVTVRRLREDPKQALIESLFHTIKVVQKDEKNIVEGKVGNTTSTFYPSLDGGVATLDSASGWSNVRNDTTGNYPNYTATTLQDGGHGFTCAVKTYGATDFNIVRSFTDFDTSPIGTDEVVSGTISLHVDSAEATLENNAYAYTVPVAGSPASESAIVEADIDNVGSVAFATGIAMTSMVTGAYVDWTLNASGLVAISTTGKSRFAWRVGHDLENQTPPSSANKANGIVARASEYAGTSSDPKLVVVHNAVAPPTPDFQQQVIMT